MERPILSFFQALPEVSLPVDEDQLMYPTVGDLSSRHGRICTCRCEVSYSVMEDLLHAQESCIAITLVPRRHLYQWTVSRTRATVFGTVSGRPAGRYYVCFSHDL